MAMKGAPAMWCRRGLFFVLPASQLRLQLGNPGADDPWGQVDLTPEAKIGMPPLPKIKMTPVDIEVQPSAMAY